MENEKKLNNIQGETFGFTSSQLTSEDLGVGGAQMIPRLTLPVSTHLYAPN